MAWASAAIAPPKRCTLRSTTIPVPEGGGRGALGRREPASPVTSASSWRACGGMAGPSAAGPDDVAQHGAGLDRGQLLGVAHQHQPRIGADRLQQSRHQRQRDHGRLVDHDDVMGQPVQAIVTKARAIAGIEAEQPVHASCPTATAGDPAVPRSIGKVAGTLADGVLQPCRRLSGRGGQRHQRRALPRRRACASRSARTRATVVVFPVPGPPAITDSRRRTAVAAAIRWSGSSPNSSSRPLPQQIHVDAGRGAVRALAQLGRHQALVRPQAVQVQGRPLEVQRAAVPDDSAGRHLPDPRRRCRPRQRADVRRRVRVGVRRGVNGGQVHADVAQTRGPRREGRPQGDDLVVGAAQPGQPQRDVDIRRREDAGVVEGAQRSAGAARQPGVERRRRSRARSCRHPAVEEIAHGLDQGRRRPPGPDAAEATPRPPARPRSRSCRARTGRGRRRSARRGRSARSRQRR